MILINAHLAKIVSKHVHWIRCPPISRIVLGCYSCERSFRFSVSLTSSTDISHVRGHVHVSLSIYQFVSNVELLMKMARPRSGSFMRDEAPLLKERMYSTWYRVRYGRSWLAAYV